MSHELNPFVPQCCSSLTRLRSEHLVAVAFSPARRNLGFVRTDHDQVTALSVRVEEAAFVLLALQAPVAAELRAIVSSVQIAPT